MKTNSIEVQPVNKQYGQSMQNNCSREEVEQALETVLKDHKFAAAPQMSAFLRFVVTQTLDGNAERIKAYTVAVDALGKPDTFDPQSDPSVRVLAKRLRDTLTAYYERTTGHQVFLRLYTGSYVPQFQLVESFQTVTTTPLSSIRQETNDQNENSATASSNVDSGY